MKKITESGKRLLALCYSAFFVVSLLACTFGLAQDRILRAKGEIVEQTVGVDAFELYNLYPLAEEGAAWDGASLVGDNPDPRMILVDCPTRVVRVDAYVDFINMEPGEFTLFYKPRAQMTDFDANYRVWGELRPDGSYAFTLPMGKTYGLRIDPGIFAGLQIKINSIVLNAKQPALSFFAPSNLWLLSFAVIPALIASAVTYLSALCKAIAAHRAQKS